MDNFVLLLVVYLVWMVALVSLLAEGYPGINCYRYGVL